MTIQLHKSKYIVPFLLVGWISNAWALNVQLFRPNDARQSSMVNQGVNPLQKNDFHTGIIMDWVKNPIEFGVKSGDSRIDDVVNWIITTDVLFSYGFSDRFGMQVDVPINWAADVENILSVVGNKRVGLGDIRVNFPIKLRKEMIDNQHQLGILFIPFFTAPTGNASDFLGESNWTGGGWLEMNKLFSKRHRFLIGAGYRFREEENILNLTIDHEALANFGYVLTLSTQHAWDLFVDLQGSTTTNKFLDEEISSPVEFLGGFKKRWSDDRWMWIIGGGRGMNNGYGAPDIRVFMGLSYLFHPKKKEQPVQQEPAPPPPAPVVEEIKPVEPPSVVEPTPIPPPAPIEKIDLIGKVLFEFDKATILPASYPILDNVVDVLKRHMEIHKVEIQAHTDSKGNDDYNLALSNRRAKSVLTYLVEHGVEAARLRSLGCGESRPIATNDTQEGRDQNRRVEFIIIDPAHP